jgi:hypothetical protein
VQKQDPPFLPFTGAGVAFQHVCLPALAFQTRSCKKYHKSTKARVFPTDTCIRPFLQVKHDYTYQTRVYSHQGDNQGYFRGGFGAARGFVSHVTLRGCILEFVIPFRPVVGHPRRPFIFSISNFSIGLNLE